MFLNFSDSEPGIILKLFFSTKGVTSPKKFQAYFLYSIHTYNFVDVFLHHNTNLEFIFCIDNAKVHLKAVLQQRNKNNSDLLVKLGLALFLNFS